ncbi:cytochrome c3 family protein [Paracoccus marinaquae]|nr:cytochrome c3 family protein [Paracoccus marinaquae]
MLAALFFCGLVLVVTGPPGADDRAGRREPRFGGTIPVLPMTFSHGDHFGQTCASCHHEFTDGTAGPPCMTCHVTDRSVAPLLEDQFHGLCRSCHVTEHAASRPSGPTRNCTACHLPDHDF